MNYLVVEMMLVFATVFLVGAVGMGIWLVIEYVVDRMFDNNDLGDSDYGC